VTTSNPQNSDYVILIASCSRFARSWRVHRFDPFINPTIIATWHRPHFILIRDSNPLSDSDTGVVSDQIGIPLVPLHTTPELWIPLTSTPPESKVERYDWKEWGFWYETQKRRDMPPTLLLRNGNSSQFFTERRSVVATAIADGKNPYSDMVLFYTNTPIVSIRDQNDLEFVIETDAATGIQWCTRRLVWRECNRLFVFELRYRYSLSAEEEVAQLFDRTVRLTCPALELPLRPSLGTIRICGECEAISDCSAIFFLNL
jgi:hypothetical protein